MGIFSTIRNCVVCGKTFQATHPRKKFCSPECAGIKRAKKVPKKRTKQILNKTFDEIVSESDACGLSYGKYKLALKTGKTFEELKAEYEAKKSGDW